MSYLSPFQFSKMQPRQRMLHGLQGLGLTRAGVQAIDPRVGVTTSLTIGARNVPGVTAPAPLPTLSRTMVPTVTQLQTIKPVPSVVAQPTGGGLRLVSAGRTTVPHTPTANQPSAFNWHRPTDIALLPAGGGDNITNGGGSASGSNGGANYAQGNTVQQVDPSWWDGSGNDTGAALPEDLPPAPPADQPAIEPGSPRSGHGTIIYPQGIQAASTAADGSSLMSTVANLSTPVKIGGVAAITFILWRLFR